MMLLASLMGMLVIGATAFWGVDSMSEDRNDDERQAQGDDSEDLADADGMSITDIATEPEPDSDPNWTAGTGTHMPDTIVGTPGQDMLIGYEGDDLISGDEGNDQIDGEVGNDSLEGGAGNDWLFGRAGDDSLEGGTGADLLLGDIGDDTMAGGEGDDTLKGGAGQDSLSGNAGDDALHGYLGNDTLDGGPGQDSLFGGTGNDLLTGLSDEANPGEDRDYLNGGHGDDTIIAGNSDNINGGRGADTFQLGDWLAADHQPKIEDFETGIDSLMILYDANDGAEPEVSVEDDQKQSGLHHVVLNGVRIAMVHSNGGLGIDDITLMPQSGV